MNYQHIFHAGNFADLLKHAALLDWLRYLQAQTPALRVIDTHAGAGLYDLSDPAQLRSREAEAGIARLMTRDIPLALRDLSKHVMGYNPDGEVRLYPGSPRLVCDHLRPDDRYTGCELRESVFGLLSRALQGQGEARLEDGYDFAQNTIAAAPDRAYGLLIDPPFEQADDYVRIAETVRVALDATHKAGGRLSVLIWLPLKDLETLDSFVRRLEAGPLPHTLIAEARLRPLTDPMKMNGCALVVVNPPVGMDARLADQSEAIVATLGDPGGRSKVWAVGAS